MWAVELLGSKSRTFFVARHASWYLPSFFRAFPIFPHAGRNDSSILIAILNASMASMLLPVLSKQSPSLNGIILFCDFLRSIFWNSWIAAFRFPVFWYAWASRSEHCSLGFIAAALVSSSIAGAASPCCRNNKPKFRSEVLDCGLMANSLW